VPFSALHTASQPEHVDLQTKVTSKSCTLHVFIAHRTDDTRLLPKSLTTLSSTSWLPVRAALIVSMTNPRFV
jgi:hypothetical protein